MDIFLLHALYKVTLTPAHETSNQLHLDVSMFSILKHSQVTKNTQAN